MSHHRWHGGDHFEGIFGSEARGVDCGSHVGLGLSRPHGAIAVGDVVDGAPTASNVPRWMLSQTI